MFNSFILWILSGCSFCIKCFAGDNLFNCVSFSQHLDMSRLDSKNFPLEFKASIHPVIIVFLSILETYFHLALSQLFQGSFLHSLQNNFQLLISKFFHIPLPSFHPKWSLEAIEYCFSPLDPKLQLKQTECQKEEYEWTNKTQPNQTKPKTIPHPPPQLEEGFFTDRIFSQFIPFHSDCNA